MHKQQVLQQPVNKINAAEYQQELKAWGKLSNLIARAVQKGEVRSVQKH